MIKNLKRGGAGHGPAGKKPGAGEFKYLRKTEDDYVLTSGMVARACGVATRTAVKWMDKGRLLFFRVPGGQDRRILASNLLKFMRANNIPAPTALVALMEGTPEVVAVYMNEREHTALWPLAGTVPVKVFDTLFDTAIHLADKNRRGLIVVGTLGSAGEANLIADRMKNGWKVIRVYGDDGSQASRVTRNVPHDDPDLLLETVRKYLTKRDE